jgi:hypothetical protein
MLMDHSNAEIDCYPWRGYLNLFAININPSAVRLVQAMKDIHECGFARTVLT